MKRIGLFILTNLAVLLVISITLRLLGVDRILDESGAIKFDSLLILSMVIGFSGSIISLLMSKWSAKRMVNAQVITSPIDPTERWLLDTVKRQSQAAGIGMPEVAIYDAPDVNAFATGWNRNNALVAVSTGLLQSMSRDEAEAVLAHEVSHVANGDMVTLALIQGVVNTFVIFFAKLFGILVDRVLLKNDGRHGPGIGAFVAEIIAQVVLGVLASIIVMWFSRQREFRADAGAATLAGRNKMIAALERLKAKHEPSALPEKMAAFGISGGGGFSRLFMTHPPLEERIAALREGR
ncbi:MAG: zinc metalloprotease HtpX [Gallionellales bacterium 35-53-114]|jgi:heat shock protein HtpX|nr:MAG: zinc metalloprotease HtpX [Gallionellales bacterium 35-53-114]OYZ64763.1 MAG: zinc metalloprotease HtpX [Gallionellales bacterium 24-53-125]OZB07699.1 MAG: zinc metalloprotease HtpX [Gallionellales bacterium 39-52-133]HQS58603.1 protease HtpX [Gallionellaceae bacterium]HQS74944.1 protease HtpX [Gallionellaceae bacterium]